MKRTEWTDKMFEALEEMNRAVLSYKDAFTAGRDRTLAGRRVADAYYAICALDNGVANVEHNE